MAFCKKSVDAVRCSLATSYNEGDILAGLLAVKVSAGWIDTEGMRTAASLNLFE